MAFLKTTTEENGQQGSVQFSDQFLSMESYIRDLQNRICHELEELDHVKFKEDLWQREGGGGGKTRIIQNGAVFEKGGVNTSSVHGQMPEEMAQRLKTDPGFFAACGISLVIHPLSPKIPTAHMNLRYFEMENGRSWFGGGIDLTPYFPYLKDFKHFHKTLKNACDAVIPESYQAYKQQCDEYFTIKHRNEIRGIGGIFFDYLTGSEKKHYELVQSVGEAFLKSYLPLVRQRSEEDYTQEDKQFQLVRRGRYVEFNLVYDRGTQFGLKTGGRIESIFMSLPPVINFPYDWKPRPNTPHEEMCNYYHPIQWID